MLVGGAGDATGMRRYLAGMLSRMPVENVSHRVHGTHSVMRVQTKIMFGYDLRIVYDLIMQIVPRTASTTIVQPK